MQRRSQKALVTKFISDKRCSGSHHTPVHLVHEGDLCYQAQPVEVAIVHHVVFRCFELVVFVPDSRREVWTRYYFSRDTLFQKLKPEDLSHFMAEALEYSRRHRRHFSPEVQDRAAKYDGVKKVIVDSIPDLLQYDAARRFVDAGEDSCIPRVMINEMTTIQNYDYKPATMIISKPDYLVPVNVDPALTDSSYDTFLRSDRERKLIILVINCFSKVMTSKFQPVNIGRKNERLTAKSSTVTRRSNSIYANIRASLHRMTEIFQSNANAVVPCDDSTSTADSSEVSPTKQDSLVQLHSKKKPVTSGLMSSLVQRQISFFRASIGVVSSSKKDRNEDVSAPIYVSYARFRWLKAVDKVITRNTTQYFRQVFLRQSMMAQLTRVIMRQRSDFMTMVIDETDVNRLPILMLPTSQFAFCQRSNSSLVVDTPVGRTKLLGRPNSMVELQSLLIDTSVRSRTSSPQKSTRTTASTPAGSPNFLPFNAKDTSQSPSTPLVSYRLASGAKALSFNARTSPPTPARILAKDSPLFKHASEYFQ